MLNISEKIIVNNQILSTKNNEKATAGIAAYKMRFYRFLNQYALWRNEELRKIRLIKQVLKKR